ncbi:helix-turn-helix domain-containing protein [Arthrobacter mobilis]|uniref:Helix-turn-helix domain-containing protein n=1 Tax=Arthrobacter mobilis TaxID=2724944 RepID=A0A7X6HC30_9MICC|nr:helix-turn-helix domain-containing protein [Arthrobacter mobilis]NKX52982.1 helix-turn-helix domain-containing protein [Arthrobacter mobilis]
MRAFLCTSLASVNVDNIPNYESEAAGEGRGDLHPQSIAILRALIPPAWTAKQLAVTLPQAALYRHLNTLLGVGLVDIAHERQARGSVERTAHGNSTNYRSTDPRQG